MYYQEIMVHLLCICNTSLVLRLMRGRGERAWYTLFVHAQFSQDFWEFGNSCKICSVTLTSTRHTDFSRIKMPATGHALCRRWWGNDEGTQLFACKSCPHVRPFQLNAVAREWRNLSIWSSPITSNEAMQTVTDKAILFVTSKPPICVPQGV